MQNQQFAGHYLSFVIPLAVPAHAVFDVVVDDEIQLLACEAT